MPFTEQLRQGCTFLSGKNLSDLIFRLLVLTKELRIQSLDTSDQIQLYNNFQALINTKKNRTHKILENKRHKHTLELNNLDWHTTVMSLVQSNNATAVSAAACLHQWAGAGSHKNQTTQKSKKHTHKPNRGTTVAPTGSIQKRKIPNKIKNKRAPEAISPNSKAQQFCQQLWQTKISVLQLTKRLLSGDIIQPNFISAHAALMLIQITQNKQITNSRGNAPTPEDFQYYHEPTLKQQTFKKFITREKSKLINLNNATRKFYKNRTAKNREKLNALLVEICHPLPEAIHFFDDSQAISLQLLNCLTQIESITDEIATKVAQSSVLFQVELKEQQSLLFWGEPSPRTGKGCAFGAIGDGRPTSSSKQASPTSIAAIATGW